MRISDWSSDVCSSDLLYERRLSRPALGRLQLLYRHRLWHAVGRVEDHRDDGRPHHQAVAPPGVRRLDRRLDPGLYRQPARHRSEEHTSELQSLLRNSYAVFGLKKTT